MKGSVNEVACKLRCITGEEWSNNPEEYQGFLDNGFSVQEEAVNFKQQGYFFGPLGNTMVLAVSNTLGLPVVIFSYITPRVCKVPVPLFVAFNQADAGHYDAMTYSDMSGTSSQASQCSPSK